MYMYLFVFVSFCVEVTENHPHEGSFDNSFNLACFHCDPVERSRFPRIWNDSKLKFRSSCFIKQVFVFVCLHCSVLYMYFYVCVCITSCTCTVPCNAIRAYMYVLSLCIIPDGL